MFILPHTRRYICDANIMITAARTRTFRGAGLQSHRRAISSPPSRPRIIRRRPFRSSREGVFSSQIDGNFRLVERNNVADRAQWANDKHALHFIWKLSSSGETVTGQRSVSEMSDGETVAERWWFPILPKSTSPTLSLPTIIQPIPTLPTFSFPNPLCRKLVSL